MALDADAAVRQHTNGDVSLALAMGRFAEKRLPAPRPWHPADYIAALDQELGMELLVPMYERYRRDRYFPD